jgi:hypothetical protein
VRQAIRLASSYGPEEYIFRIESKDKEIPCPPTHHHNQHRSSNDATKTQNDKRSANDVTAATPAMVAYYECCGGWGHDKPFCKWAKHTMANNAEKSFKNSHAGTNTWRLVGADKFMTNKIVPGYEAVKKDDWKLLDNDYNARRANNAPNKIQKMSVKYKGSNPRPYDQLYNKNSGRQTLRGIRTVARIGFTFPDSRPWTRNLDPYALERTPHSPPPQDAHHLLYLHDTLSSQHHAL